MHLQPEWLQGTRQDKEKQMNRETVKYRAAAGFAAAIMTMSSISQPVVAMGIQETEPVLTENSPEESVRTEQTDTVASPDMTETGSDEMMEEGVSGDIGHQQLIPETQQEEPAADVQEAAADDSEEEPAQSEVAFMDGRGFESVQAAVDSLGETGTGTIELRENHDLPVTVRAVQNVTIRVNAGVTWTNSQAAGGGWGNSVIVNNGTLTLENEGTIAASAQRGSSFAVYNQTQGVMSISKGVFTSYNGDYIVMNQNEMTITGSRFDKTTGASPSMILNGWRNNGEIPAGHAGAHLTVKEITMTSTVKGAIGIKNDDHGYLNVESANINTTFNIQNNNEAVIHGGTFTSQSGGCAIYNYAAAGIQFNTGKLTVLGGDFFATEGSQQIIRKAGTGDGAIQIAGGTYWADQESVRDNVVADHELREMPELAGRYHVVRPVVTVDVKADKDALEEGETLSVLALVGPEEATYRQATWRIVKESLTRDGVETTQGEATLTEGSHVLNHEAALTGVKAGTVIVEVQADGITARRTFQVLEAGEKPGEDSKPETPEKPGEDKPETPETLGDRSQKPDSKPDQDQSAANSSRPEEKPAARPSQVHTAVAAAPGLFAGIMTVTAGILACAGRKGKKNRG